MILEVDAALLCRLPASMVFGTLRVILDEQAERCKAKQKGLEKPHEASGWVVYTFFAAETQRRNDKQK